MAENSLTAVYQGLYGIAFAASMMAFLMTSMQKLRFLIVLSSAAVTGLQPCMCLRWNLDKLRALCARHIKLKLALENVLSSHMARKLSHSFDDRSATDTSAIERG